MLCALRYSNYRPQNSAYARVFRRRPGEQWLTLAENEKGRFVAVDERGAVHYLSAVALGEKPWEVQRELEAAFKAEGSVQLPGVAELREELQEARAAERAENALGGAVGREPGDLERAAAAEEGGSNGQMRFPRSAP